MFAVKSIARCCGRRGEGAMRKLLLAAVCVLALPSLAGAAPLCASGTLNDYIALGPGGCAIGNNTYSDFSSAASLFGGTEIAATDVTVTPAGAGGHSQLAFGINAAPVGPGAILGILIGYAVAGPALSRTDLLLSGA